MLSKLGGRKTVIGMMLTLVAVGLDVLGPHGLTEVMSTFLLSIGIGYFGANVLVKGANSLEVVGKKKAKAEPASIDLSPILVKLEELESINPEEASEAIQKLQEQLTALSNRQVAMMEQMGTLSKGIAKVLTIAQGE